MKIFLLQFQFLLHSIFSVLCISAAGKCVNMIFDYEVGTQIIVIVMTALAGLGCLIMGCWFLYFGLGSLRSIRKIKKSNIL